MTSYQNIIETARFIQKKINITPNIGIVLGTGLGALVQDIDISTTLDYSEIPHFPIATVEFHKGKLIFGTLGGKPIVCMQGRFHYYEGYSMAQVAFPVQVMKLLGVETLLVSNASGGINPNYSIADLMLIEDHISLFLPKNPLVGANIDELGDRFPDMCDPYDIDLLQKAENIAKDNNIRTHRGVYASVSGPQLETRAEYRLLRMIGADAVGMSTVPEIIVARQMNMRCFGISVITDMGIPETLQKADINNIIAAAAKAEPAMTLIIKTLIEQL